ncbi:MAG: hypothetical protein EHM72_07585, partial [Calditrichaeota bacterium]
MKTFLIVVSLLMNGLALAQSNWPLINYDAYNSKWAKSETKLKPPLKLVKAFGEADGAIAYFNGVVYSGYSDTPNRVVAYSLDTEQELWRFAIPGSRAGMGFSPAVSDSILLIGAQVSDSLYALNRFTGKVVWRLETFGLYARNACITDDRVYILGNRLYCLDLKSGREIWRFIVGGQTSPAVDGEHVYIGGRVIDKKTGLEVYSFSMNGMDPIVLDDNLFYFTARDSLCAVEKKIWKKKWAAPIPQGLWNNLYGGCTAVTDKTVTFVLWANWPAPAAIYTLNKENGQELW